MQFQQIIATGIGDVVPVPKYKGWSFDKTNRSIDGIVITDNCRCVYTQDGHEYVSSPESVIFLVKGTSYHTECFQDGTDYLVDFNSTGLGDKLFNMKTTNSAGFIKEIRHMILPGESSAVVYSKLAAFYTILTSLTAENSGIKSPAILSIAPSLDYIRDNFTRPGLTLAEIAAPSKISVAYFRQLFAQVYGISPIRYVNDLRIARAKQLLAERRLNISEIAADCGWANVYCFSGYFRKSTGYSPTEYIHRISKI